MENVTYYKIDDRAVANGPKFHICYQTETRDSEFITICGCRLDKNSPLQFRNIRTDLYADKITGILYCKRCTATIAARMNEYNSKLSIPVLPATKDDWTTVNLVGNDGKWQPINISSDHWLFAPQELLDQMAL